MEHKELYRETGLVLPACLAHADIGRFALDRVMSNADDEVTLMTERLEALLIEDSEDDATLIVHELEHGGYEVLFERIDTSDAIEEALQRKAWDIILCDHAMPHICAPEALQIAQRLCPETPFVVVSGWMNDELAESARKEGARDFVRKNNLMKLVPVVQRELKKAKPKVKKSPKDKKKRG